jgi:hypothetical protein
MRRIEALAIGVALAFGLPALIALVLYGGDGVVPMLLYWPLLLTDKLGLTACANANAVSDKMSCAFKGLLIDVVVYPLAIWVCANILRRLFSRRDGDVRPSLVL